MDIHHHITAFSKKYGEESNSLVTMVRMAVLSTVRALANVGFNTDSKYHWETYNEFRNTLRGTIGAQYISRDVHTYMQKNLGREAGVLTVYPLEKLEEAIDTALPDCRELIDACWEHYEIETTKQMQREKESPLEHSINDKEYKQTEKVSEEGEEPT